MRIDVRDQIINPAFPLKSVYHYTSSALPIEIVGVPGFVGYCHVVGVKVRVTNANAQETEVSCERSGEGWKTLLAATNFATYGFVSKGIRVKLVLKTDEGVQHESVVAVGDLDIRASSAAATPGTPGAFYVIKGSRAFERSQVVGGVQHYVERTLEYVPGMGWGANWTGDFILDASGEFVPATTNQEG